MTFGQWVALTLCVGCCLPALFNIYKSWRKYR